jgi:ADP-heptose:LPS heptosyltransferase
MAEVALVHLGIDPLSEFIAVHPGMGGSAINLSARQYVSLVSAIENKTSLPVVVSIGPTQTDQKLGRDMGQLRKGTRFIQGLSLPGLKEFFRKAKTVIAPSTGPLHLAHLVGTPTIGIYSPVKSQHATRWRPYGGIAPSEVIYPEVSCPGKRECMGTKCPKFFCMDQVPWTELILNHMQGMKI